MRSRTRKSTPSPWPFWLLLVAWFCANFPQGSTYAVAWLAEARSFSHQQRLTADVARVLVGEETPALLVGLKNPPSQPAKPSLPPGPTVKKVELALEESIYSVTKDRAVTIVAVTVPCLESMWRTTPPYEPPRATVVS